MLLQPICVFVMNYSGHSHLQHQTLKYTLQHQLCVVLYWRISVIYTLWRRNLRRRNVLPCDGKLSGGISVYTWNVRCLLSLLYLNKSHRFADSVVRRFASNGKNLFFLSAYFPDDWVVHDIMSGQTDQRERTASACYCWNPRFPFGLQSLPKFSFRSGFCWKCH